MKKFKIILLLSLISLLMTAPAIAIPYSFSLEGNQNFPELSADVLFDYDPTQALISIQITNTSNHPTVNPDPRFTAFAFNVVSS